jgi:HAMP domain-containing protein
LIEDMIRPTTEVTRAIGAVAQANLTQTVRLDVDGRPLEGEFLRSANIVNTMIQQLSVFTAEVTRVAREVGTDGKLGGQAQVPGVAETWKDLTDSVNSMASNLTDQVRNIAEVTNAVANGDLSRKITVDVRGEILRLKEAINTMVDQLRSFASEVTRVAREVGTDGKLGGQAVVPGVAAGTELARQIKSSLPELPVVLLSGVNEVPSDTGYADLFLRAVGPVSLCENIAKVLDGARARNQDRVGPS